MNYPINEIFYSVQGEGFHTGTAAIFIRFSGCNLRCPFCDTDFSKSVLMTTEQIMKAVKGYQSRTVIVTGGEPTLHNLTELVESLHSNGYRVHLETNGTNNPDSHFDWITCSPKLSPLVKTSEDCQFDVHLSILELADEVKIVNYSGIIDKLDWIECNFRTRNLFLQPCSCENIKETLEWVLMNPEWRLSLQTHKLINIP